MCNQCWHCPNFVQTFMPHTQPCRACEDLRVFLARWKDVGQHPRHVKRSLPPGGAIRRTCSCVLLRSQTHCSYKLICALLGAHMHSSYMHWLLLCSLQLVPVARQLVGTQCCSWQKTPSKQRRQLFHPSLGWCWRIWRMLKNLDQDKFDSSSCLAVEFDSRQLVNSS